MTAFEQCEEPQTGAASPSGIAVESACDLEAVVAICRLSFALSRDLVLVLDVDGRVVYLNPRAEDLLGYPADEILGKTLRHLSTAGDAWPELGSELARTSEPLRLELSRKGGTTIWTELSLTPIGQPNQIGWVAVARDVSSQRRAEQRLLSANRELSAVRVVLAEATQAIDLQATLDTTLGRVLDLLDAHAGVIFLLTQHGNRLSIAALLGLQRGSLPHVWGPGLRIGEGVAGRVVLSGEPLVLENVPEHSSARRASETIRMVACVPMRAEGHIVGAIGVGRRSDEVFSAAEVRVLASIGSQVGVVIENARLRAELARKASRLAGLYQSGQVIAGSRTKAAIFSTTARFAAQLSGSQGSMILINDVGSSEFYPIIAHGLPPRSRNIRIKAAEPAGEALSQGRPVVANQTDTGPDRDDASGGSGFLQLAQSVLTDARSVAIVPMRARSRVLGALLAVDRSLGKYDEHDIELLSCLADQAAGALEHVRLHSVLEEQAERASALNEITKAVVADLDLKHVIRNMATQVRRLIAYDRLLVGLIDEATQMLDVFVFRAGIKGKPGKPTRVKREDIVFGKVIENSAAMIRTDLRTENHFAWDNIMAAAGMRCEIAVPLQLHGRAIGAIALMDRREGMYGKADLDLLSNIADQVSMAVENAQLYHQTAADLRELAALRELVESFSSELDLSALLHKIIVAAVELVQADTGSIALAEDSDGAFRLRALHNIPNSMLGREITSRDGVLGQVILTNQPVMMHQYGEDAGEIAAGHEHSHLAVPIDWQGSLTGIFAVGSKNKTRHFGRHDAEVLQLLAKHAAIAIENARLYRQSGELAITEERNRLARDIHDTLAQSLTGIVLQLETVGSLLPEREGEAWHELQEARTLARRALDEARQSVWGLHPTPLKSTTIDEAIEREIRLLAKQANVATHFTVRGDVRPLQPDVATALFRIAQEALNNVRKHAAAKSVRGILEFGVDHVDLTIEDDGVGIQRRDPERNNAGGFGLTSMGERARLLGGELRVESAPGKGTRLLAAVPYAMPVSEPIPHIVATQVPDEPADIVKVLVADDHPIARQGIRRVLESYSDIVVVGEAADGVEAVSLSDDLKPDVILMDLQMPRMNGVEAIAKLRAGSPDVKVLMISTYAKDEFLFEGIKAGARGYLLKDVPPEELAQAVRAVSRGESLLHGVVAGKLLDRLGQLARGEGDDELTDREAEVLNLLAKGARNKEIARRLFIAEKTVKFHVANIFRKLNVSSRTEALAQAFDRGLLDR